MAIIQKISSPKSTDAFQKHTPYYTIYNYNEFLGEFQGGTPKRLNPF